MLRKSAFYHSSDLSLIQTATVHSAAGCLAISWATVGLRRNLYLIVRPPSPGLPSQRLTGISLCWRQHQKASVTHVSIGIPEHGGVPPHTTDLPCVSPPQTLGDGTIRPYPGYWFFCLSIAIISHCRLWLRLLIRVKQLMLGPNWWVPKSFG